MEYLENNKIKNEVIEKLIEKLYNYEEQEVYGCGLGYKLFEGYNIDGSVTCNAYAATQWIKENFDDLGEIVENIQSQGLEIPNIFESPESFMVIIYLEVANYVMGKCKFIDKNWNDKLVLNKENIKTIKKELESLKEV